jgi:hypothetical protein
MRRDVIPYESRRWGPATVLLTHYSSRALGARARVNHIGDIMALPKDVRSTINRAAHVLSQREYFEIKKRLAAEAEEMRKQGLTVEEIIERLEVATR